MPRSLRGFTLIELLVVIAIIAILASIVLASLGNARTKSRDARRLADLKQLRNALELYNNDNGGNYPASTGGAIVNIITDTSLSSVLVPKYIAAIPKDPLNSGSYVYQYQSLKGTGPTATACSSSCNDFVLTTTMENSGSLSGSAPTITGVSPNVTCGTSNLYCTRP